MAALALQYYFAPQAWPQAGGVRFANTTLRLPLEPSVVGFGLTNVFGEMTFDDPVCVKSPPGETNRLFVVERAGRITVITNLAAPNKTVFLDLSSITYSAYLEAGLLGLAFHPGFNTNRYCYVYRTAFATTAGATNLLHDVLSRFEVSPADPNSALPGSEQRLIAQYDDAVTHNAGDVQFGPDGYLYVSLGYSSPPPRDRSDDPQAIDKGFFGGIIRIDVDKRPGSLAPNFHPSSTTNYAIPPDNPFIGRSVHNGRAIDPSQIRTEYYAIGLRNPWRMTFDWVTGLLLCGDVGAGDREEINLIEPGGNYGWPHQEGTFTYSFPPTGTVFTTPLHEYLHGFSSEQGRCVVGGLVYGGAKLPGLDGAYLFGDYVSGSIWALRHQGSNVNELRWLAGEAGIVSFGTDPRDGEVLAANLKKGVIQKLVYIPREQAVPFPEALSHTGLFSDIVALTPEPGVVPFEVNVPFWSDNASKRRWFSIPDTNACIGFDPIAPWRFPPGTVWIKHFDLELITGVPESNRRIETRVLVKNAGGAYGVSYRWNESQTDAELVPANGMDESIEIRDGQGVSTQIWHYPGRMECPICHTRKAGYALGFNTAQLAREITVGGQSERQIDRLSRMGYFTTTPTNDSLARPLASSTNTMYPLGYRVHSYLTANCAHCHQPGGGSEETGTFWDARFEVPLADSGTINGTVFGAYGGATNRVVKPNSLEHSILFYRVNQRGPDQMPPLATTLADSNSVAMLREWILTFPPDPWQSADIGFRAQEGFGSIHDGAFRVSGSGQGIQGTADSFHFLHQTVEGDVQLVARLAVRQIGSGQGQAGLMFRDGLAPDAPFVMLQQNPMGEIRLSRRQVAGGYVEDGAITISRSTNAWLKLVRQGDLVSGFTSDDGILWELLERVTVTRSASVSAGFAVSSRLEPALHTVDFQDVNLTVLTFSIASRPPFVAPTSISLHAEISGGAAQVSKVEFFADENKVGEADSAPFDFDWNPVDTGDFVLTARVTNRRGDVLVSSPVDLAVILPKPKVQFIGRDTITQGNWRGVYGSDGYFICGYTNRAPQYASIAISDYTPLIWAGATTDERALLTSDGTSRFAAAWSADKELVLKSAFTDGQLHQLTLYFLDWEGYGARTETVELWDADGSTLLHQETLSAFSGGAYLRWVVRGGLRIRIVRQGGTPAVLSAIFFDPYAGALPAIALNRPPENSVFAVPASVSLQADAVSGAAITKVQFFANDARLGESTVAPYSLLWTNAWPGSYALTARAVDELGESQRSAPVSVTVSAPETKAEFVGADSVTQGNWIGRYGFNGFILPALVTNSPPFAPANPDAAEVYVWENPSVDARALQLTNAVGRIASCWSSASGDSISITVALLDGEAHKVSLYFLDWDRTRVIEVELLDASKGSLLDARSIQSASEGVYYTWIGQGRLRFRVNRLSSNAVLSGVFFDPLMLSSRSPRLSARQLSLSALPSLRLNLRGVPNYPYRIELSTNLMNWVPLQVRIASPSGRITIFDSLDTDSSVRFYGAVLQQ